MSCHCDIIRCIQAGQFEIKTLFMRRIRMFDKGKMFNVGTCISYFYPGLVRWYMIPVGLILCNPIIIKCTY